MASASSAIIVLTGASGAGKTAVLQELEAMRLPGVRCIRSLPAPGWKLGGLHGRVGRRGGGRLWTLVDSLRESNIRE